MTIKADFLPASAYNSPDEATPMITQAFHPSPAVRTRRPPLPAIRLGLGVNIPMKKPTRFKVGIVSVTESRTPTKRMAFWELRYVDPDSGMEVRRRVQGLDRAEVATMADHLTRQAYQGKGYLAGLDKAPSLEEGIVQAVQLSRARDYGKTDMLQRGKHFVTYMTKHYPAVKTWDSLRPGMLEAYVRCCEAAKMARDSIRLRLVPVKAAWRRMNADYPELVKPVPQIRLAAATKQEIECLDAMSVTILLDWLKVHKPDLWPMACLQALAGLRMLEAAALRHQDVDLDEGTVTVTDTGRHKPKTRDSYRTIPVCREVVTALRVASRLQGVKPSSGELFTDPKGNPWKLLLLSQRWARALQQAAATPEVIQRQGGKPLSIYKHGLSLPVLASVPARKLRASFATMAGRLGCQDRILKSYMGHAAGDMLGNHYRRIGPDELRKVSALMQGWQSLAKQDRNRKHSGNNKVQASANG